ncbi:MAG: hypothetical protein P4L69_23310 [Desulfosporosinus sp.]|nr:hypothetical protein [Desulfosporosinus sp.]
MTFLEDFGEGFITPFKWSYDQVAKRFDQADKLTDKVVGGAGNVLDILGGNFNILVYAGIGLVAVILLPKILDRVI